MAAIRERRNGTFELKFNDPRFVRPHWTTHDTWKHADDYSVRLSNVLKSGVVPPELQHLLVERAATKRGSPTVTHVLKAYLNKAPIAATDKAMVEYLCLSLTIKMDEITLRWCDDWVQGMKTIERLAPGTIRKKVESLARAYDWWLRENQVGDTTPVNPLRMFPKGYSIYKAGDGDARLDVKRDRRLSEDEPARIEAVILGAKPEGRERPLAIEDRPALLLMWRLIVNTGLRLREAYRLRVSDVRFSLRTLHIPQSKTGKARDVPMTRQAATWLEEHCKGQGLVFPFWDGDINSLIRTTNRLSQQFSRVFDHAGIEDLTEHDLRHEATCRWMLMRDAQGRFLFRPEEVRRITGHQNVQQFERYLSLRGSDLADRLWGE